MKPFVKWAGGKKQILPAIIQKIEECLSSFNKKDYVFIEPFVGGGVVFLSLANERTIINDLNKELITAYRVIRDRPEELMAILDQMFAEFLVGGEDYYREIRNLDREQCYESATDLQIASRMIFLNKTCFNGLYRVNSEGFFNTPMGRNKAKCLYDPKNIRELSAYLRKIPAENIMLGSYKNAMARASAGDIVYIDPPYDYIENDGFTKYQKEGFSLEDLRELREECDKALDSEAFVIISNNDTSAVRKAFENDSRHNYSFYAIEKLETKRLINCKGDRRRTGREILIIGTPCRFPQTKDVNKLLKFIRVRHAADIKKDDLLAKRFRVTKKEITQVLSTLRYFDILDSNREFTANGVALRQCPKIELRRKMRDIILAQPVFMAIFEKDSKNTAYKTDSQQMIEIMKSCNKNMRTGIARARVDCLRTIIDWCLAN